MLITIQRQRIAVSGDGTTNEQTNDTRESELPFILYCEFKK